VWIYAEGVDADASTPTERFTITPARYRALTVVALVVIGVITVTGAAVRLTGSGMGCETWPRCTGEDFISFRDPNQAIEQGNRILSGLAGMGVAVAALVGARRRRPYRRDLVWWSVALVAGVVGQMPLGGITVLTHLHPAAVASHFVLSMLLLCAAVVLVWRARHGDGPAVAVVDRRAVLGSRAVLVLGALLLVSGPAVTGTGPNAGGVDARRFGFFIPDVVRIHAINMWVFLAVLVVLMVHLARRGAPAAVLRRGNRLLAAIVAQGAIGYVQYWQGIPPWLVIAHVVGAVFVAGFLVWFHVGLFDHGVERRAPEPRPTVAAAPVTT
jgi:cytochrome c oxidase assembly protein subunit 15